MRIIYLESGMFGTMVGESGGMGHQVTHGLGCDPDIDAFVEVIRQLTT